MMGLSIHILESEKLLLNFSDWLHLRNQYLTGVGDHPNRRNTADAYFMANHKIASRIERLNTFSLARKSKF